MVVLRVGAVDRVLADVLLLRLDGVAVQLLEQALAQLDVAQQGVAAVLGEVLADHDAQHLEVLRVRRHRVRRDDPAAGALWWHGGVSFTSFTSLHFVARLSIYSRWEDSDKSSKKNAGLEIIMDINSPACARWRTHRNADLLSRGGGRRRGGGPRQTSCS